MRHNIVAQYRGLVVLHDGVAYSVWLNGVAQWCGIIVWHNSAAQYCGLVVLHDGVAYSVWLNGVA